LFQASTISGDINNLHRLALLATPKLKLKNNCQFGKRPMILKFFHELSTGIKCADLPRQLFHNKNHKTITKNLMKKNLKIPTKQR
jgi:hypothetical protein